jgi:hypothetical protein
MSTPTFKERLRDVNLIFASVLVCSRIRVASGPYCRDFLGAEQPSSVLVCFEGILDWINRRRCAFQVTVMVLLEVVS